MIDYGTRIKFLRQQASLTQAEFAKIAKVSPRAQFNYEKGESSPDLNYLQNLANNDFDVVYILTGEFHQENMSDLERLLVTEFRKADRAKKSAIMAVSRSCEDDLESIITPEMNIPVEIPKETKPNKGLTAILANQLHQFSDSNSRYFWFYKSKDDEKK